MSQLIKSVDDILKSSADADASHIRSIIAQMDVHACQTRLSELVTKTISVIYSKISSTESRFVLHGFLSIAVDCIDGLVRFNKAFISRDDESNSEKPLRNPLIELIDTLSDELSLVNVNSSRQELLRPGHLTNQTSPPSSKNWFLPAIGISVVVAASVQSIADKAE